METSRRWFLTLALGVVLVCGWGSSGKAEEAAGPGGEEVRVTLNVEGMH